MVCNVLQIKSNQVSVVLCLEVVVAFLIQVSLFHDPVRNKTVSKNPVNFQFSMAMSKNPGNFIVFLLAGPLDGVLKSTIF